MLEGIKVLLVRRLLAGVLHCRVKLRILLLWLLHLLLEVLLLVLLRIVELVAHVGQDIGRFKVYSLLRILKEGHHRGHGLGEL